jgi:hypothetical protein
MYIKLLYQHLVHFLRFSSELFYSRLQRWLLQNSNALQPQSDTWAPAAAVFNCPLGCWMNKSALRFLSASWVGAGDSFRDTPPLWPIALQSAVCSSWVLINCWSTNYALGTSELSRIYSPLVFMLYSCFKFQFFLITLLLPHWSKNTTKKYTFSLQSTF